MKLLQSLAQKARAVAPFRAGMLVRGGVLAGSKAAAFFATVLIARNLSPAEAGGFFFSLSLGAVLGLLFALGLGETASREVPRLDATGGSHLARPLLAGSVRLVTMAAAVGSALAAVMLWLVIPGKVAFIVAGVVVGVGLAFQSLGAGFLRARHRYGLAEAWQALAPTLFLIALVPSVLLFDVGGGSLLGVRVGLEVLAGSLALGCVLFVFRGRAQEASGRRVRRDMAKTLLLSAPLWVTTLCWLAVQQSGVVALGLYRDPSAVGIYAPILKVAEACTLTLAAITPYLLPEASRLDARGDYARIQTLYDSATKWVFVAAVPLIAPLVLVPRETVHLMLGIRAPEVATVSRLLAASFLLFALFGASEALLQANCRARKLARRSSLILTATVVINIVLVRRFGIAGAAIGNLVAYSLFAAINARLLHTELLIGAFSATSGRVVGVALVSTVMMGLMLGFIDEDLTSVAVATVGVAVPTLVTALMPTRRSNLSGTLRSELQSA